MTKYYALDPLAVGDVVAAAGEAADGIWLKLATEEALELAGAPLSIVRTAANEGARVDIWRRTHGPVPATYTGLPIEDGFAVVNPDTGRAELVSVLSIDHWPLGTVDAGALTLDPRGQVETVPDAPDVDPFDNDDPLTVDPAATGVYTESTFTYASSIDAALTSLGAQYCYDNGCAAAGALRVLNLVHGVTGAAADFTPEIMRRFASYGFLVIAADLRATSDCNGREVFDARDAVVAVQALLPSVADDSNPSLVGYSLGGGLAVASAIKLPGFYTTIAAFFPVADPGHDILDGWWFTRENIRPFLTTAIGDRGDVIKPYRARDSVAAIAPALGLAGTYLYLFHDAGDGDVTPANSRRIADALASGGLTNWAYSETDALDDIRWQHGYPKTTGPSAVPDLIDAERQFVRRALGAELEAFPKRGSLRVNGSIECEHFQLWLGDAADPRTTAGGGTGHAAELTYDALEATYRVRPLTGDVTVQVIQGARTKTVAVLAADGVTEINLNDVVVGAIDSWTDVPNCTRYVDCGSLAAAGNPISQWNDEAGANLHLTGSGSNRPVTATVDGVVVASATAASSHRLVGAQSFDPDSAHTVAFISRIATGTDGTIWSNSNTAGSSSRNWLNCRQLAGAAIYTQIDTPGDAAEAGATGGSADAWHFVVIQRNGTELTAQIDDAVVATSGGDLPSGVITTNRCTLFALEDPAGFVAHITASLARVGEWNRALDAGEITALRERAQADFPSFNLP
jgi:hypothetical protein